jgi:hypothetical protein
MSNRRLAKRSIPNAVMPSASTLVRLCLPIDLSLCNAKTSPFFNIYLRFLLMFIFGAFPVRDSHHTFRVFRN